MKLKLDQITIDAGTQTRIMMNEKTIAEYAADMTEGTQFPDVVVFASGTDYLLADGFHRFMAAQRNGWREIDAEVRTGSRLDAIKYSLGANNSHGLRRTNADKRRCVEIALTEFTKISDQMIADMCGVCRDYVMDVRHDFQVAVKPQPEKKIGKDCKLYPATKTTRDVFKDAEGNGKPTRKAAIKIGPPCCGIMIAGQAIARLEEIAPNDTERDEAFDQVAEWLHANRKGGVT